MLGDAGSLSGSRQCHPAAGMCTSSLQGLGSSGHTRKEPCWTTSLLLLATGAPLGFEKSDVAQKLALWYFQHTGSRRSIHSLSCATPKFSTDRFPQVSGPTPCLQ